MTVDELPDPPSKRELDKHLKSLGRLGEAKPRNPRHFDGIEGGRNGLSFSVAGRSALGLIAVVQCPLVLVSSRPFAGGES